MTAQPDAGDGRSFSPPIDAFMALSRIYFESAERLSLNTLVMTRSTLEDCAAAARKSAAAAGPAELPALALALGQSMLEKCLAYTWDSYQAVSSAQLEASQVLAGQSTLIRLPVSGEWQGALDALTRGFRNFSSMRVASFANSKDVAWPFAVKHAA